jgi:flagellar export protein FliJ
LANAQTLHRLHGVRQAEESRSRTYLDTALAELHRHKDALTNAIELRSASRALLASSVRSGEPIDRIAAMQALAAANLTLKLLQTRIGLAQKKVDAIRQESLAKRIERRQVESLLDALNAQEKEEERRKIQAALDEWHNAQRADKNKRFPSVTH